MTSIVCKNNPDAGEASPIASFLREQLATSPSSARRQLFSPSSSSSSSKRTPGKLSGTPTRPIPIAPKPALGSTPSGSSGGVTVTLLRDYLQQQHSNIAQQLQGSLSPGASSAGAGSPGRLDATSPLKLAVSVASAGTQTSPCRPLTSSAVSTSSGGESSSLSIASLVSAGRHLPTSLVQVSDWYTVNKITMCSKGQ